MSKQAGRMSQGANDFLAPGTPTIASVTDVGTNRAYNNGAVDVAFNSTGVYAASSYTVLSSGGQTATGSSSPIRVEGLLSETAYTFKVKAVNSDGESAYSSDSSSVTVTTVPATPSAPSASSPSAGVDDVSWSAPANGGKAITNYYWTSDDGKSGNTSSTSVSVSQEQGTAQTYNVRADNANGSSATSPQSGSVTTVFSAFGAFGAFNAFGAFGAFGAFNAFGAFAAFGAYKSISLHTLVLTPSGYTQASSLKVGDELVSTEIPGLGINFTREDVYNWSGNPDSIQIIPDKVTTITHIGSSQASQSVSVNGEIYSGSHTMLVKRDDVARMVESADLLESDQLWSSDTNTWTPITELIISNIPHEVISLNCEPYDMFYTDHFLVYDGYQIEN
jgi:hypothetical protein